MPGWTNKGKYQILGVALRAETMSGSVFVALVTSAGSVLPDTNTFSELTEIAAGNGYITGGTLLTRNSTDFDTWTEDDTNDRGFVQLKDIAWTGSGGSIPPSGSGARYAVLTSDGGSVGTRSVYYGWDLASDRTVSSGQALTLQNCEIRINEI